MRLLRPVDGPPCAECPYREDVEPGIWPDTVYIRLTRYDGTLEQQEAAGAKGCMFCIRTPNRLCGGWIAAHPLPVNLALQMHAVRGELDLGAIRAYRPGVPVFGTGAAAVIHGTGKNSMLTGVTLLNRNRREDRCDCGHRRFSHDGGDHCAWCACLMFKLEKPAPPRRPSVNVDALADEIVEAVKDWAKGDPAKIGEAAKILSVSALLGELPAASDTGASGWHCTLCDDCPIYRLQQGATACKCGHSVVDHAFDRDLSESRNHDRQEQPA
jgi:hypothetical protein